MVPLVSNGHTISSLIARPCLILSTRPKQQKRNVFKGCDNYCYSAFELWELSNCLSFDGKFKTQSMHCCKQREKITEVPQFKRTITVERSICKITVVIYILDQYSYKKLLRKLKHYVRKNLSFPGGGSCPLCSPLCTALINPTDAFSTQLVRLMKYILKAKSR